MLPHHFIFYNNLIISLQEPIFLDKCVICWEQDWDDYFEIQELVAKEAFIFKASTTITIYFSVKRCIAHYISLL